MKIDLEQLRKREKYICEQKHPVLDLIIWNYTNSCQFDNAWDEYTSMARGLITDLDGNIISRPFKKFFNINTFEGTKLEELPAEIPEIYEKIDGSLGISYPDGDRYSIATRGSFSSDQAIWATKWLKDKSLPLETGFTYLFEIIYPENRIVVNYGNKQELVLLAVINIETGEEINFEEEAKKLGVNCAKKINSKLEDLLNSLETLSDNEEGYVVRYSNNFRVKMKGQEYVRLHRLITGFSNKSIWELLANNQKFDEFLERVPDEFYKWVNQIKTDLGDKFSGLSSKVNDVFELVKIFETRKEQAIYIISNHKGISSAVFPLLDGNQEESNKRIWKMIKPKFSKPFKGNTEEF